MYSRSGFCSKVFPRVFPEVVLKVLTLSVFTLLFAACGGDGDSNNPGNPGGSSSSSSSTSSSSSSSGEIITGISISGQIVLPDGSTPLNNAIVYIADETPVSMRLQKSLSLTCQTPPVAALVSSCTDAMGNFMLEGLEPGVYEITVIRGAFSITFTVDASATVDELVLEPVQLAEENGVPAAAMALVTGNYDTMQNVLAKTGFGEVDESGWLVPGTQTFAVFDGNDYLDDEAYPNFDALFAINNTTGLARIYDYSIVFINCGVNEVDGEPGAVDPTDENVISVLRAYVESGGRLYATDWAYDYIEQAFPEFLDFYGDDEIPANMAEGWDIAQQGLGSIVVDSARINDSALSDFLAAAECDTRPDNACLNSDGTMYIEGFLGGWSILNGAHQGVTGVTLYTDGEITTEDDQVFTKPLTASFPVGEGFVFYSSYHSEDIGHTGFLPQERVMQYLIFE